jgi:glutamyl-tRNA(Gln) amidotransferase subunit E
VEYQDGEVLRHMRPTLSELGEYDGTALMEFKTRKEIVYLLERGSVCTYEIDDTPPFPIDDQAVEIALEIAQLCDLNLVAELHVMRKQYLDGSIPTGFQRTAMVGLTGRIPFRVPELGVDRSLAIRQLSLEEDSCREVRDVGHRITFRTDRLGMPLTETVTEPELLTPLEVQAGGRLLAQVARASGKVRRGPGAARQDVNVSVAGGRRVEIKGVDNHRFLPRLVHIEAFRQLNLLRVRAELLRRGTAAEAFGIPEQGDPWDQTSHVAEVGALLDGSLRAAADGMRICAVRLPGFGGLLAHRTQPGRTFAHELSERVRVIACPIHAWFLTHSDAPDSPVTAGQWRDVRRAVRAERDDAVVLVWVEPGDAATATREILLRAGEALKGIPAETRQAHRDGTTGFERILPGADRMYPDTDTPPLPIHDAVVERIRAVLPERPWERVARYRALGLPALAAERLSRSPWQAAFDTAAPAAGDLVPRLAASLAKRAPFHLRSGRSLPPDLGTALVRIVGAIRGRQIRPEALDRLVDAAIERPGAAPEAGLPAFRGAVPDVASVVAQVASRARALSGRSAETRFRWAMGEAMAALLGRTDPAEVRRLLAARLAASPSGVTP